MYNPIVIKSDILELGNLKLGNNGLIRFSESTGYNIKEHYRVFDSHHEMNVMKSLKGHEPYIIISDTDYYTYKAEKVSDTNINHYLRYIDKKGILELKKVLYEDSDDSNIIKTMKMIMEHNHFKNEQSINISNMSVKYLILCSITLTLIVGVFSTLLS